MTIQEYVDRGRAAVEAIKDYTQEQVDKLCYEGAKIIYQHAAELAREAGYLAGRQEALCLPVMEAERKQGYLEGLKEGKKLAEKNDRLKLLEKMAGYIQKGLNYTEIGKILGLSKDAVAKRVAAAKKKGFWPLREKTCQINLPGVM